MLYKANISFYFNAEDDEDAEVAVLEVLESELESECANSKIELTKVDLQQDQHKTGYFDEDGYFYSFPKNDLPA